MVSDKATAFCEIETSSHDAGENVKFRSANVDNSMRADNWVSIGFRSVVAKFFDARDEDVAEVAAASDGAVAGLAGSQAARGAGVN